MTMSLLDYGQVIRNVFDSVNSALQVNVVAGSITVVNNSVGVIGSAAPTSGTLAGFEDGSGNLQYAKVNASKALTVDGSGVTQPVSCTVLPAAVGQTTKAGSLSVAVASDQTVPVSGTFWQATQPVSGTFYQTTQPVSLATAPTTPVTGTFWQTTQPVSGTVAITYTPALVTSATGTCTNVASSATNVSLLASNASRKGAYFFNDSTSVLYLKFGTTASATSYTVQVQANGYYEMPTQPVYTGEIDGIWASANGNARVTEMS